MVSWGNDRTFRPSHGCSYLARRGGTRRARTVVLRDHRVFDAPLPLGRASSDDEISGETLNPYGHHSEIGTPVS
jgi:hypothetical protein